jgi:hypothetical protein
MERREVLDSNASLEAWKSIPNCAFKKPLASSAMFRTPRSNGLAGRTVPTSATCTSSRAATSLSSWAESFSPDAIISHAYEGAHIDHDACSFLAMHVAAKLSLKRFEFPLYWIDRQGRVVLQQFRDVRCTTGKVEGECAVADVLEWRLNEAEIECKKKMLAEYRTQRGTVARFSPAEERMRVADNNIAPFSIAMCRDYMYQNLRPRFLSHATPSHFCKSATEEVRRIRRLAEPRENRR